MFGTARTFFARGVFATLLIMICTDETAADYTLTIVSPVENQNGYKVGQAFITNGDVDYNFYGGALNAVDINVYDDDGNINAYRATLDAGYTYANWTCNVFVSDCSGSGRFVLTATAYDSSGERLDSKRRTLWLNNAGPGPGPDQDPG